MTYTYKLINDPYAGKPTSVRRSDGWAIPFVDDNADYQEYLAWLAEGNTPEEADSE